MTTSLPEASPFWPATGFAACFLPGSGRGAVAGAAVAAQTQIAVFFASGGTTVIDPDGAGSLFETPMVGPPPENLAFLP